MFHTQSSSSLTAALIGQRETVCLLHNSIGLGLEWRGLATRLATRYEVLTPNLNGEPAPSAPSAAAAGSVNPARLQQQAGAQWAALGFRPVHLVGYALGGALALQMALMHPARVLSLTLYEPLPLGLLPASDLALQEMQDVASSVASLVAVARWEDAARVLVGYWGGASAWTRMDTGQRRAVMARLPTVPRDFEALFATRWDAHQLAALQMPVLLLRGTVSRLPAQAVQRRLLHLLPQAQAVDLPGAGHLGPLTHAAGVAHCMAAHLDPALAWA